MKRLSPSSLRWTCLTCAVCLLACPAGAAETGSALLYNRDVRPILSNHCFKCHGPDIRERQAGLRLDLRENALLLTKSGAHAIVPKEPARSALVERIFSSHGSRVMPPPESNKKLTDREKEILKKWIEEGADYQTHWSFLPPRRPDLPKIEGSWVRNPIDHFILARLEAEGLRPSPETDKSTLIRRLTLDLTGLPPTPADVDAFLADADPKAYEKVVERLLSSPQFGERMALEWLDVARYADTHGYHIDSARDMSRWRDWVIDAFNRNLPFDRFTIEQLAGDMLPNPTLAQRLATGFNRNHMITEEDGAIPEEYLNAYIVDRVNTTATVWLGLTVSCCQCHDHKYDPITQKDYYQLYAFFHNVPEKGLDGLWGNAVPHLKSPTPEQQEKLEGLAASIKELLPTKARPLSEFLGMMLGPLLWGLVPAFLLMQMVMICRPASAGRGSLLLPLMIMAPISSLAVVGHCLGMNLWAIFPLNAAGVYILVVGFFVLRKKALSLRTALYVSLGGLVVALLGLAPLYLGAATVDEDAGFPSLNGYGLMLASWLGLTVMVVSPIMAGVAFGSKRLTIALAGLAMVGSGLVPFFGTMPFLSIEQWRMYLGGCFTTPTLLLGLSVAWMSVTLLFIIVDFVKMRLNTDSAPGYFGLSRITRYAATGLLCIALGVGIKGLEPLYRVHQDTQGETEAHSDLLKREINAAQINWEEEVAAADTEALPARIKEILAIYPKGRSDQQKAELNDYFWPRFGPVIEQRVHQLVPLRKAHSELEKRIPTTMVMREMAAPRDTFVLVRGQYDKRGEKVTAAVPASLPPLPKDAPANRLGLALWLVDPSNPLTARVAVNRYWQMLFGAGLVKTAEDFGTRGDLPSHPELLDWLAVEFMTPSSDRTQKWDVKALLKIIVTSATYRQSSALPPSLVALDPENRLLARGPRLRLQAEFIRDQALAVSGLLDDRIGGPSVSPYQPPGLWKEQVFREDTKKLPAQAYVQSHGKDLYRRTMYTFWKRISPPPTLTTFDAPDRETCTIRRPRTNTPLQALVLLNDPTYVESSRKLAEQLMTKAVTPDARIALAFRLATARLPNGQELAVLRKMFEEQLAVYRKDVKGALKLLSVGESKRNEKLDAAELAAWATIAGVILNLDETVTKG